MNSPGSGCPFRPEVKKGPSPAPRQPAFWPRLIALCFRLLYNELAWLYDPVSWIVSLGKWRAWQRTALPFLPPGEQVLEVGFGPGHLLVSLAEGSRRPVGLDRSASMLRLARRRLRRRRMPFRLVQGSAHALPFAPGIFESIVLAFPTPFVYEPNWIRHLVRVLRPGGRLIVVESAHFTRQTPLSQGLEWLYRVTGQRGPVPDLPALLAGAGLASRRESIAVDDSTVDLVVADKQ